jgi:YidC/Oxa1 family membrane protein insertase
VSKTALVLWSLVSADAGVAAEISTEVATESMTIWFSTTGAVPIAWELTDARYTNAPLPLIEPRAGVGAFGHPLEIVAGGQEAEESLNRARFTLSRSREGDHEVLRFESPPSSMGVVLIKTFRVPARGFELTVELEIVNRGPQIVEDLPALGLRLGPGLGEMQTLESGLFADFYKYVWPIFGADGDSETLAGLEPEDQPTVPDEDERLEWIGIHNRFFMVSLAPLGETPFAGRAYLAEGLTELGFVNDDLLPYLPTVELSTAMSALEPGESHQLDFALYAGPKVSEELSAAQTDLSGAVFVGSWLPMRWLCHGITWLLEMLHVVLRSWGLAIIVLALVIRMIVFPLYRVSLASQAKTAAAMALMKPKFAEAKQRLKADPLAKDEAILAIYKEHGVSPFGSLFGNVSLLIQIPIFIALFKVVGEAYALEGASFLWITNLAETEKLFAFGFEVPLLGGHFNLLPVLMAATQIVASALTASPSADRKQQLRQKLTMVAVGVAFFFLFYSFPAGLVLYWWMATFFASLQQRWITKRLADKGPSAATSS